MTKEFNLISKNAGRGGEKDRWECPICRSKKEPECRFNLSKKKRGLLHKCRFCKSELKLAGDKLK